MVNFKTIYLYTINLALFSFVYFAYVNNKLNTLYNKKCLLNSRIPSYLLVLCKVLLFFLFIFNLQI